MAAKEDFLIDFIVSAGELTDDGFHFKDNDLRFKKVLKHSIPYSKFEDALLSSERWRIQKELEAKARERFGVEYWMKYQVCFFCTSAAED